MADLQTAFEAWCAARGVVWFQADVDLAEAIAEELGVDLVWDLNATQPLVGVCAPLRE